MRILTDRVMYIAVASITIILTVGVAVCLYVILKGGIVWA